MPLSSLFQRFRQMAAAGQSHGPDAVSVSPSDVEAARVRARRRLIGMVVLVGAGVIGFPWLFETQPRQMSRDVEIVHAGVAGGDDGLAVARGPSSRGASGRVAVAGIVPPPQEQAEGTHSQGSQAGAGEEVRESISSKPPAGGAAGEKPAGKAADPDRAGAKEGSRPATAKETSARGADKASDRTDEAGKAEKEKTVKRPSDKVAEKDKADDRSSSRYVVQFGAFADAQAARTARMKVEKLGIKTYAQQVDTPAGKRIRVRIGPFADKAEADKALAALRKAGLAGAVLTL